MCFVDKYFIKNPFKLVIMRIKGKKYNQQSVEKYQCPIIKGKQVKTGQCPLNSLLTRPGRVFYYYKYHNRLSIDYQQIMRIMKYS